MTLIVAIYLAVGALLAALLYFVVRHAIEALEQGETYAEDPEGRRELEGEMQGFESALTRVPGGMLTVLVGAVLLWPAFLVMLARQKLSDRDS